MPRDPSAQDVLYEEAAASYGPALERLARAYERDADKRRDLLQEIHVALWRSFAHFEGRCSMKTWVYRVAHNTATSVAVRRNVRTPDFVTLDQVDAAAQQDGERALDHQNSLDRLWALIHRLAPHDRQVILLYLEGLDAASIGEVVGSSPGSVATKIHRIKAILGRRFHEGVRRAR
jgi:RNA polymerase sigma-70 factor (ECF subfamily)